MAMKRVSVRLLIALLTFIVGVAAVAVWLFLNSPDLTTPAPSAIATLEPPYSGRYENPAIQGGLFHVVRGSGEYIIDAPDGYDERALIISFDNKPIEHGAGDSDAPTRPGFYLSRRVRLNFERVEVIGKNVYFKTINVGGVSYEFSGISGAENIPGDALTHVPFIKGVLTRSRDGKAEREEEIKFRYAGDARTKS